MPDPEFITDAHMPPGSLVLFDFDGTLSKKDSLFPFLRFTLGGMGVVRAFLLSAPWLLGYGLHLVSNNTAKARLLKVAFGKRSQTELKEKGRIFAQTIVPHLLRPDMMARVAGYRKAGCCCVLVSASLDFYLQPWAKAEGIEAVICSSLQSDRQGRITGGFRGNNCYGEEKVRRIHVFMQERGIPASTLLLAYGDSRGDIPMMKMAHRAWWVKSGLVQAFDKANT